MLLGTQSLAHCMGNGPWENTFQSIYWQDIEILTLNALSVTTISPFAGRKLWDLC